MAKPTRTAKKGPAGTPGSVVSVRLNTEQLNSLDVWIHRQNGRVSRPEAIRQLVSMALADRRQKPR